MQFFKNEGQKLAFHAGMSSARRDCKFDKYFLPKRKLKCNCTEGGTENLLRIGNAGSPEFLNDERHVE